MDRAWAVHLRNRLTETAIFIQWQSDDVVRIPISHEQPAPGRINDEVARMFARRGLVLNSLQVWSGFEYGDDAVSVNYPVAGVKQMAELLNFRGRARDRRPCR